MMANLPRRDVILPHHKKKYQRARKSRQNVSDGFRNVAITEDQSTAFNNRNALFL